MVVLVNVIKPQGLEPLQFPTKFRSPSSAALDRLDGARTSGFHLGSGVSTIDLDRELSLEMIAAAEAEANRVAWEDRRVSIRFVSGEQAADLGLRKEPKRTGRLRLIEIKDFDRSACGGTHVSRTGAIGIVAVSSWERFKGGTRLEFVCGGRALGAYRSQRDALAGSVRLLSVLPAELPDAVARTQSENKELKRMIRVLHGRLADHEAALLAEQAQRVVGVALVTEVVSGYNGAGMKDLATAVVKRDGFAVALLSATTPVLVVIARSNDVEVDASAVLRGLTARFGGRGGGEGRPSRRAGV